MAKSDFLFVIALAVCTSALCTVSAQSADCKTKLLQCVIGNGDDGAQNGGDDCYREFTSPMTCVKETRQICQLKEDSVTFDELISVVSGACKGMAPIMAKAGDCSQMSTCMSTVPSFEVIRKTGEDIETLKTEIAEKVVNPQFWCSGITEIMGCFGDSAGTCSLRSEDVDNIQGRIDKIKAVACNHGTKMMASLPLLLLSVALGLARSSPLH